MNITIVGLGVIGGSIGLSLRGKIYGAKIKGIDINNKTLDKAKELNIIEEGAIDGSEASTDIIENSDIIFLSIYPKDIKNFIDKYRDTFKSGVTIIDTSGIKGSIVKEIDIPKNIDFILVHPMAGREKRGIEYASRKVFIGANFIITTRDENKVKNIEAVKFLAKKMGFTNIVETSIMEHDEIIAFTSQLPHAIAVALVNSDNLGVETGSFIGDSYKEITRIANINEDLWSELFINNKENLISKMESFEKEFNKIKIGIKNQDEKELKKIFVNSSEKRKKL
ncbi:prephenate dehydrogenase [Clostridium mediterraneense]|uniref:prephenate dehydrogenase n=1 Tax=Clostridium mediterraneense TaxID=1805472 RepID=UPI00082D265F|nr:prephenate dehydrogenase [Clostridium mediterraneense]